MKLKEFKQFLSIDQDMIRLIVFDHLFREIPYILIHSDVINFLNNRIDYSSEEFAIRRHELEEMEVRMVYGFNAEGYNGIIIHLYEEE